MEEDQYRFAPQLISQLRLKQNTLTEYILILSRYKQIYFIPKQSFIQNISNILQKATTQVEVQQRWSKISSSMDQDRKLKQLLWMKKYNSLLNKASIQNDCFDLQSILIFINNYQTHKYKYFEAQPQSEVKLCLKKQNQNTQTVRSSSLDLKVKKQKFDSKIKTQGFEIPIREKIQIQNIKFFQEDQKAWLHFLSIQVTYFYAEQVKFIRQYFEDQINREDSLILKAYQQFVSQYEFYYRLRNIELPNQQYWRNILSNLSTKQELERFEDLVQIWSKLKKEYENHECWHKNDHGELLNHQTMKKYFQKCLRSLKIAMFPRGSKGYKLYGLNFNKILYVNVWLNPYFSEYSPIEDYKYDEIKNKIMCCSAITIMHEGAHYILRQNFNIQEITPDNGSFIQWEQSKSVGDYFFSQINKLFKQETDFSKLMRSLFQRQNNKTLYQQELLCSKKCLRRKQQFFSTCAKLRQQLQPSYIWLKKLYFLMIFFTNNSIEIQQILKQLTLTLEQTQSQQDLIKLLISGKNVQEFRLLLTQNAYSYLQKVLTTSFDHLKISFQLAEKIKFLQAKFNEYSISQISQFVETMKFKVNQEIQTPLKTGNFIFFNILEKIKNELLKDKEQLNQNTFMVQELSFQSTKKQMYKKIQAKYPKSQMIQEEIYSFKSTMKLDSLVTIYCKYKEYLQRICQIEHIMKVCFEFPSFLIINKTKVHILQSGFIIEKKLFPNLDPKSNIYDEDLQRLRSRKYQQIGKPVQCVKKAYLTLQKSAVPGNKSYLIFRNTSSRCTYPILRKGQQ